MYTREARQNRGKQHPAPRMGQPLLRDRSAKFCDGGTEGRDILCDRLGLTKTRASVNGGGALAAAAQVGHIDIKTVAGQIGGQALARTGIEDAAVLNGAMQQEQRRSRICTAEALHTEYRPTSQRHRYRLLLNRLGHALFLAEHPPLQALVGRLIPQIDG